MLCRLFVIFYQFQIVSSTKKPDNICRLLNCAPPLIPLLKVPLQTCMLTWKTLIFLFFLLCYSYLKTLLFSWGMKILIKSIQILRIFFFISWTTFPPMTKSICKRRANRFTLIVCICVPRVIMFIILLTWSLYML